MPLPQAPKRQLTKTFLTPIVGDVLFVQIEDRSRADIPEYGTPHPDVAKWPNHKLVFVRPVDNERDNIYEFFYAADRDNQDDYNWEFTKADFSGAEYSAVQRTYVIPRSEFNEDEPAMASLNPDTPTGVFIGDYVLASRRQQRMGDKELDSLYVVDVRLYVKRCELTSNGVDPLNGKPLPASYSIYHISESVDGYSVEELVSAPEDAYWGVQEDGTSRTFKALSCEWYRFDTERLVAGSASGGIVDIGSYETSVNYYWPPVFSLLEFMDWERRDGGTDIFPRVEFDPEDYRGPCRALIERTWSKDPQSLLTPNQMLPTPIIYGSPFFNLNIPACLHGEVTAQCDTSNTDPIYTLNVGSSRTIPATNFTTWPESIVASDDQEPYKGGYLRTKTTIYKPA